MKRIFFAVMIGLSLLAAQQTKFVSTKGQNLVTPDRKLILLRGINLGNWLVPEGYMFKFIHTESPHWINETFNQLLGPEETKKFWKQFRDNYITQDDIAFIKKSGLNSVRVPFNYRLFVSEDHNTRFAGPGFEMLDRVIKWCSEEKLYVVLDMHCAPGGQTGDDIDDSYGYPFLFESSEAQQLTIDLWKAIAKRYAKEPTVIGYDLLNEPIATHFDASAFNSKLEPLYRRITAAVREVDTNHILFFGGAQWNTNFSVFGAPFDKRSVYTFHKYWCDTTQLMVQEYVDFSKKYNVPVWMGESGENTDQWIDSWRQLNERNNIGWCFWPYKKMDALNNMVSMKRTAEWDSVITFANKPRTSYKEFRDAKPSKEVIKKAFADFLENCKFSNCTVNEGYMNALGLKSKQFPQHSYRLDGNDLVNRSEKIAYKKSAQGELFLYLLRPEGTIKKPLPAIVYFFGGGWVNGSVEYQIANAAWFRDQGIIGITADYRIQSKHGTSPLECIKDAKSAIRFVRAHAEELGIDPDNIIAAGGSAGGHIAACTAVDGGDEMAEDQTISSKPNALVLHNPVLGEGFGASFFADHPEFSPMLHITKGMPPTILSNGTKDGTTPYVAAQKFTRLMNEAGNICELITVPDADHSCDWPVSNPNFLPTLSAMTKFLRDHNIIP